MNSLGDVVLNVQKMGPGDMSSEIDANLLNSDSSNRIGGKRRTFDFFEYAVRYPKSYRLQLLVNVFSEF